MQIPPSSRPALGRRRRAAARLAPQRTAKRHLARWALLVALVTVFLGAGGGLVAANTQGTGLTTYIVSSSDGMSQAAVSNAITSAGGQNTTFLGVGSIASTQLSQMDASYLTAQPGIIEVPDAGVTIGQSGGSSGPPTTTSAPASTTTLPPDGATAPPDVFEQQTGATQAWSQGDLGQGVTVAVLDTGIEGLPAFTGRLIGGVDLTSGGGGPFDDQYGHGTFVAGLIAGTGVSSSPGSGGSSGVIDAGEAPAADLVAVKVAGASGSTDLATLIRGIGWTLANAQEFHIRVLNMSLGIEPAESTFLDPLDQAVEAAWNAGIVVVVSAGNAGPFNGTVLSPGDDPFVITAGAINDQHVAENGAAGDLMSGFSSVGPAGPDAWIKPDLVTSGRSVVSVRDPGSTIDVNNPSAVINQDGLPTGFVGSGTSFSAAITSGAAALVLADHPSDTPNAVKAALLGTTNPGPVGNPLVDGHGALDIAAAVGAKGTLVQQPGDLQSGWVNVPQITVTPGSPLEAGLEAYATASHANEVVQLLDGGVTEPVSCSASGPIVGALSLQLPPVSAQLPPSAVGSSDTVSIGAPSNYQASAVAPNLCQGGPMYSTGQAELGAEVTANLDPGITGTQLSPSQLDFEFHLAASSSQGAQSPWSSPFNPAGLSLPGLGTTVSLGVPFVSSSWNQANWLGSDPAPASTGGALPQGLSWNGAAWNSTAPVAAWGPGGWTGSEWNGSNWSGSEWNGSEWNGSEWNGSEWNGNAWDGSEWNGSEWNGSEWNAYGWDSDQWN